MTGNRDYLRKATQSAHQNAETGWTRNGRFAGLTIYRQWLERMLRAHQTLGLPACLALGGHAEWAREQRRIACLRADLGLGSARPDEIADMSRDLGWGVAYALNGSAIGATRLIKPGITPDDWPGSYLHEMADYAKSGALWAFFRALDGATPDLAEATRGAFRVFACATLPKRPDAAAADDLDEAPVHYNVSTLI